MVGTGFLWFYLLNNIGMKKIIIIAIALMAIIPSAVNAQERHKTPSATKNYRAGNVVIRRTGSAYTIVAKTDFILFDEYLSVFLGIERKEVLESINKLIEISEFPYGNIFPFKDIDFKVHDSHIEFVNVKGKIFYGKAIIYDRELKSMKKFIERGK